jgi:hypothetical protein
MTLRRLVGMTAVVAPALHSATDALEWLQGGFSQPQLWLNYAAFLPMPALMIGLYAEQRPRISRAGLVGALLYGGAFIYFAHTTLWALAEGAADYTALWQGLGLIYTVHGAAMVIGGVIFGMATWAAGIMPRVASVLFIGGLGVNLVLSCLPAPEILQTIGSAVRNVGLLLMGWYLWRTRATAHPECWTDTGIEKAASE